MLTLALSPETYLALCTTVETRDGYICATNTCWVSRTPLTDENLTTAIERGAAFKCNVCVTGSVNAKQIVLHCSSKFISPHIFHATHDILVTCASMNKDGAQYVFKFPLSEAYNTLMEWGKINATLASYAQNN